MEIRNFIKSKVEDTKKGVVELKAKSAVQSKILDHIKSNKERLTNHSSRRQNRRFACFLSLVICGVE